MSFQCNADQFSRDQSHNEESKTMISSDCTFFDWCNDCADRTEKLFKVNYTVKPIKPRCTDNEIVQYNADWKIIAEDCQSFFDGCNNCNKLKTEKLSVL